MIQHVLLPSIANLSKLLRSHENSRTHSRGGFQRVPSTSPRQACLDHHVLSGYNSNVVAAGRDFNSGNLKCSAGVVTDRSSALYGGSLISTCKINTQYGSGGALFNFDGNFVGLNMSYDTNEGTHFLPMETILEFLKPSGLPRVRIKQEIDNTTERSTGSSSEKSQNMIQKRSISSTSHSESESESDSESEPERDSERDSEIDSENDSSQEVEFWDFPDFCPLPENAFTNALINDLKSRGYPVPTTLDGHLRYSFEEEFARDTWSKLPQRVAYNTSLTVVSLASFKGRRKCTTRILTSASLITIAKENIVDTNLEIQVYLPNKQCAEGKLKHYDLQYNIAIIAIRGYRCRRTAKIDIKEPVEPHNGVIGIGRIFETGKLMATSGMLTTESIEFDCNELAFSTCKITKAGIGGPLIDFSGNFIGMNFYGGKRTPTPYLPRNVILKQLRRLDGKGAAATVAIDKPKPNRAATAAVAIDKPKPNKWPVREPYWYYHAAEPPRDNYWARRKKF